MSAIGLPMDDHIEPHFAEDGLCQCPCEDCTTRLAKFCVCLDGCQCESQYHDGPRPGVASRPYVGE